MRSYNKSARVCPADTLHDYRAAFDDRKGFPETFDARSKIPRRTELEDDDMVFDVVDRFFERQFELDPPPPAESALEHRQLHPFTISLHDTENAPPPPGRRYVIPTM